MFLKVVSSTEKLLAIAQYISKTLDNNHTIEVLKEKSSENKSEEKPLKNKHLG